MIKKDDFVVVQNVHRAWICAGWETKEQAEDFISFYLMLDDIRKKLLELNKRGKLDAYVVHSLLGSNPESWM